MELFEQARRAIKEAEELEILVRWTKSCQIYSLTFVEDPKKYQVPIHRVAEFIEAKILQHNQEEV